MANLPKPKGGRPRKIPRPLVNPMGDALAKQSPADQAFAREHLADALRSERSRNNAYYADIGREVVEGIAEQLREAAADNPVAHAKRRLGLDWILARTTVLTELGRLVDADPEGSEASIVRFQGVLDHVAARHDKLTATAAAAYIRGRRLGDAAGRRDRIAALHHDLNAAINLHRQRYPESTWGDVRRALELTAGQIEHKRP
jgi:hypothetical protein